MGNGQVERFNQTLLQMLGTLQPTQKSDWKSYVLPLVHAYNATRHDTTGFSPFYLMFGRHPRLALDAFLGLEPSAEVVEHRQSIPLNFSHVCLLLLRKLLKKQHVRLKGISPIMTKGFLKAS